MNPLLLDESSVLRSFGALVHFVTVVLVVVGGIGLVFILKQVFKVRLSTLGSTAWLLIMLLAVAAFVCVVAAVSG
ncbi:hypothetical protein [Hymenobacter coalescens]